MNSAEEFVKVMFGEEFKSIIPIEKVQKNSSFIGVFKIVFFIYFICNHITFITYR